MKVTIRKDLQDSAVGVPVLYTETLKETTVSADSNPDIEFLFLADHHVHSDGYNMLVKIDGEKAAVYSIDFDFETDKQEIDAEEATKILREIVKEYDAMPDGPLGRGFTNGPFLRAREFLKELDGVA